MSNKEDLNRILQNAVIGALAFGGASALNRLALPKILPNYGRGMAAIKVRKRLMQAAKHNMLNRKAERLAKKLKPFGGTRKILTGNTSDGKLFRKLIEKEVAKGSRQHLKPIMSSIATGGLVGAEVGASRSLLRRWAKEKEAHIKLAALEVLLND